MRYMLGLLVALCAGKSWAVQVGDAAPEVSAPSTSGATVKLSDFRGSWLVLYFFPKAFTPGCTAESCSLRDGYGEIQKTGATLLGVSLDSLETQKEFRSKYELPFDLLSDTKRDVAKAFDALMLGGLMAQRKTFIIDPEGRIAHVFDKVTTASHDDEVLAVLQKLQGESAGREGGP